MLMVALLAVSLHEAQVKAPPHVQKEAATMTFQGTMISILILGSLTLGQTSYGSTFCETAAYEMTHSTAKLREAQAVKVSNDLLSRLKKGDSDQNVKLSENVNMGLESFFPDAKLRLGRTFFMDAWDLNRLLEMQSKIDLVVLGKLNLDQISKVEKAIIGTGIRIFSLTFEENSEMKLLSEQSGGKQIVLPLTCP
jgi:hypothetical protein